MNQINTESAKKQETKNCMFCGEEILATAIKCRHCKSMLSDSPVAEKNPSFITTPHLLKLARLDFYGPIILFILFIAALQPWYKPNRYSYNMQNWFEIVDNSKIPSDHPLISGIYLTLFLVLMFYLIGCFSDSKAFHVVKALNTILCGVFVLIITIMITNKIEDNKGIGLDIATFCGVAFIVAGIITMVYLVPKLRNSQSNKNLNNEDMKFLDLKDNND